MIVAVDVGNSNVVIGLHMNNTWAEIWRIPTATHQEAAYYYDVEIRNKLLEAGVEPNEENRVILSTVVPSLKNIFIIILTQIFHSEVIVVDPELYKKLHLSVPRPYEIGTDLVANAFAAFKTYKKACIVVDFGTALTFTTVSDLGAVQGVAIAPGIKTAMLALSTNTAQLPEIPLVLPESALGQNTTHAIQAGILWGYVGMAKELIAKIKSEVGEDYLAIATGGLSFVMEPLKDVFYEINPSLTLDGLRYMVLAINE